MQLCLALLCSWHFSPKTWVGGLFRYIWTYFTSDISIKLMFWPQIKDICKKNPLNSLCSSSHFQTDELSLAATYFQIPRFSKCVWKLYKWIEKLDKGVERSGKVVEIFIYKYKSLFQNTKLKVIWLFLIIFSTCTRMASLRVIRLCSLGIRNTTFCKCEKTDKKDTLMKHGYFSAYKRY